MRPLEIVLAGMLFSNWGALLLPTRIRSRALGILPIFTAAAGIAQIAVERYRWQMTPMYGLAVLILLWRIGKGFNPNGVIHFPGSASRGKVAALLVLSLPILLFAVVLPALFPIFEMPLPGGPFEIASIEFEWIDKSRKETFSSEPEDRRDLMVRAWYPADLPPTAKPVPFWPDAATFGPLLARKLGMPGFLFNHLSLVQSHTFRDVPLSAVQTRYPVVVFSHAYSPGFANQNLVQMEELASHGYVVLSIAHPYEGVAVQYPDGRIAATSEPRYREVITDGVVKAVPILRQCVAAKDPAEKEQLFRQYLDANPQAQESLRVWTEDTQFVFDQLERIDQGEISCPFTKRIDLSNVGVFGHSMGGAVAGEVCSLDERCKAAVNLDGIQLVAVIDRPIRQPFLMMYSTINAGQNDPVYDRGRNIRYEVIINDTNHNDFCDLGLISPLFRLTGVTGPRDPGSTQNIMNNYIVAFFDQHLKRIDSPLLNRAPFTDSEVVFRAIAPITP
ncbi:MAG: alpha/beta hydrolase family protein [Planctomycetaceae bacterium]